MKNQDFAFGTASQNGTSLSPLKVTKSTMQVVPSIIFSQASQRSTTIFISSHFICTLYVCFTNA